MHICIIVTFVMISGVPRKYSKTSTAMLGTCSISPITPLGALADLLLDSSGELQQVAMIFFSCVSNIEVDKILFIKQLLDD